MGRWNWFERDDNGYEAAGRGRGRGRHHPPPPGGGPPPWSGGPWGGGWGGRGMFGRRARRGDVRAAILVLLAEEPRNGYQIMQELDSRSRGTWRPSSGSVYPTLQQLEDEGLIEVAGPALGGGSRSYKLTDAGKRYVDKHRAELDAAWQPGTAEDGNARFDMVAQIRGVATAAMQVAINGTAKQNDDAQRLMQDTRRALYRMLSEVPPPDDDEDDDDEP